MVTGYRFLYLLFDIMECKNTFTYGQDFFDVRERDKSFLYFFPLGLFLKGKSFYTKFEH